MDQRRATLPIPKPVPGQVKRETQGGDRVEEAETRGMWPEPSTTQDCWLPSGAGSGQGTDPTSSSQEEPPIPAPFVDFQPLELYENRFLLF